MVGLQKIIVYASCYRKEDEPVTLMDAMGKREFLADAYAWKFLLYFVIQRAVIECINVQN